MNDVQIVFRNIFCLIKVLPCGVSSVNNLVNAGKVMPGKKTTEVPILWKFKNLYAKKAFCKKDQIVIYPPDSDLMKTQWTITSILWK